MPRRPRRPKIVAEPATEQLHRSRLDFAAELLEHQRRAIDAGLRDARRRGLSAIAPAGWPVLSEASRGHLITTAAALRQAWAEGRSAEVTADTAARIAHWLEAFAMLASATWAHAATGPLGPTVLRAAAGANGNRRREFPDDPRPSPLHL